MVEMSPDQVTTILRQFNEWLRADKYLWGAPLPGVSAEVGEAIDAAVEMIERMGRIEIALREIAWSNDSAWQADRARSVLEESK